MLKNNDWWIAVDNFCEARNLTLSKLAKICGLSSSTLNNPSAMTDMASPNG